MPPHLSLIVAVYNKPEVLRLVLAACSRQSLQEFEIIVADDGSGPAVKQVVDDARRSWSLAITHLWHEDSGWRKNMMLNNAIRSARTEYVVCIDGDCIPGRDFLRDHWTEREDRKVLLGRRVETSKRWSATLTEERILSGLFERYGWNEWMDGFRGDALRIEDGIRMHPAWLRRLLLRNVRGMLGSNFSIAKEHLVAINGFDELYNGPGCGEDSDIQYRLSRVGITGKSMRNLAIQYHVWHPLTQGSDACWDRFQEVKRSGEARCRVGLETLEVDRAV
jgi:cellulose synthase/poly-beta-1,6-N-acetylglucosamine synthase-like glycosyltransferase